MKSSEFEILVSVESYYKKKAKNCQNFYDAEKRIYFQFIIDFNFLAQFYEFI